MKLPADVHDATDDPDGGIYLHAAYDADFLEEFKAEVPRDHRSWDGDARRWWVSDRYAKRALRVAAGYFNLNYRD